jgi:hypothetical protein
VCRGEEKEGARGGLPDGFPPTLLSGNFLRFQLNLWWRIRSQASKNGFPEKFILLRWFLKPVAVSLIAIGSQLNRDGFYPPII